MSYKLIACDMDGTLLTNDKKISERNKKAIADANKLGTVFAISSGRPPVSVARYAESLPERTPVIALNGALITRLGDEQPIFECPLEKETALEIFEHAKKLGAVYVAWCSNVLYASSLCPEIETYCTLSKVKPIVITDHAALAESSISKILLIAEPETISDYIKYFDCNLVRPASYCTSNPRFLEIFNKKASKAIALGWLAEYLGLDISETIAFGDGYNDLDMLLAAGLGVAMDNACDEIKAQCGLVAPSNEEDGVAQIIEELILSNQ